MKSWVLIENMGDQFETVLKATTKDEAINEARAIWNRLSFHDQKRRKEFFLIYADVEDGIVDFDSGTDGFDFLK